LALKLRSNPNIIIAKVDMDANKLPEMGIKGFPTIKLFRKGDNETIVDYKDARTVQAFLKFLKSNTR
jgi:protein disulfide-isomerase A6